MPSDAPPLAPLGDRLAHFLSVHPYYNYAEVLAECFGGSEDAYIDAYCSGLLPTKAFVDEVLSEQHLQTLLLRRISRQMSMLLAALG